MAIYKYFAVLCLVAASMISVKGRPKYLECIGNSECAVHTCCRLGMGRFSIPKCVPFGERGTPCRATDETLNVTLSYPDGESVDFNDVYFLTCPCAPGLHCSEMTSRCDYRYDDINHNNIDDIYY